MTLDEPIQIVDHDPRWFEEYRMDAAEIEIAISGTLEGLAERTSGRRRFRDTNVAVVEYRGRLWSDNLLLCVGDTIASAPQAPSAPT